MPGRPCRSDVAFLACFIISDRDGAVVRQDGHGVGEINAVSLEIRSRLAWIPLDIVRDDSLTGYAQLCILSIVTLAAIGLFEDPAVLQDAAAGYRERVGPDFVYLPLVGDRPPPLDYRLN